MYRMRGTGCGGISLHKAPGQSAGTAAFKTRSEAPVLWHIELQVGSVAGAGTLILSGRQELECVESVF